MRSLVLVLAFASGCAARTMTVEVPAQAAVHIDTREVAVIAADTQCRQVAEDLTRALGKTEGVRVAPHAATRLAVVGCSESLVPTVSISADGDRDHGWEGRSSTLVVVESEGLSVGRLIGTAGDGMDVMPRRRRALRRALHTALVADISEQIAPSGLVERRVYPQASPHTPRGLQTRAVAAEASGDVNDALELAQAAHSLSPSTELAAYIDVLERRLLLSSP